MNKNVFLTSFTNRPCLSIIRRAKTTAAESKIAEKENQFKIEIFSEASETITDPFWKEKLVEASKGIFPKFISYKDRCLIYRNGRGKNSHAVKLLSLDPKEAAKDFIDFLREKSNINPPEEIKPEEDPFYFPPPEPKIRSWAFYKKKDKSDMVDFYIEDMRELMQLKDDEVESLYAKILQGLESKIFNKNNIIVDKDNRIKEIRGLLYSKKEKDFVIDEELIKKTIPKRTEQKISKTTNPIRITNALFHNRWKKYFEFLEKSYKKSEGHFYHSKEDFSDSATDNITDTMTDTAIDSEF